MNYIMNQLIRFNDYIVAGLHSELIVLALLSSEETQNNKEKNILIFTETVDILLILYMNALVLKQFI